MKQLLLIILLVIASNSWAQKTPQDKAELAVTNHIKKTYPNREYHAYMFGNLIKITPPEIIELQNYKKALAKLNSSDDSLLNHYDSLLKITLKEVKEKKLYSIYEISHFYTLKEKFKKPILYQYTFTLLPDGKVNDAFKNLEYKFRDDEYDYFYYYYKKKDLYDTGEDNIETYAYLTDLYENEIKSKEAAMSTILTVSKVIYEYDVYDTVLIARIEAQKWLNKNLTNFSIKEYALVNSISDTTTNQTLGYNIFAKIIHNDSTEVYYFEFDYDYILRGVLPVEAPFEQYFTKPLKGIENK